MNFGWAYMMPPPQLFHCWPPQGGTSVLNPLSCSFFLIFSWLVLLLLCVLCLFVLLVIFPLWPPALQYRPLTLLFVCVLFVLFLLLLVVLSGEPKQNQGRGLVDRTLVQAPPPSPDPSEAISFLTVPRWLFCFGS